MSVSLRCEPWRLIPGVDPFPFGSRKMRTWRGTNYELRDPWRPRAFRSFRLWRFVLTVYSAPQRAEGEG
ncbi:MAG: hypothetical protein IPF77_16835 [Gemmatimonadetes bacterium]|nr:hypothetical protein [Gemmatimonadota bacterium]